MKVDFSTFKQLAVLDSDLIRFVTKECNRLHEKELANASSLPEHRDWILRTSSDQPISQVEIILALRDFIRGSELGCKLVDSSALDIKIINDDRHHGAAYIDRPFPHIGVSIGLIMDVVLTSRLGKTFGEPHFPGKEFSPQTRFYLTGVEEHAHFVTLYDDPHLKESLVPFDTLIDRTNEEYLNNEAEQAIKPYLEDALAHEQEVYPIYSITNSERLTGAYEKSIAKVPGKQLLFPCDHRAQHGPSLLPIDRTDPRNNRMSVWENAMNKMAETIAHITGYKPYYTDFTLQGKTVRALGVDTRILNTKQLEELYLLADTLTRAAGARGAQVNVAR